jgi:surface antigen
MSPHKTLSSYLVKPDLSARRHRQWEGFRTQIVQIRRYNPHALSRGLGALFIWTVVIASIRYIDDPQSLALSVTSSSSQAAVTQAAPLQTPVTITALASVAHAQALPGGPSGQLMPPGTMAADNTYRNSYARGQCTWYVAGRRQIPGNWGPYGHVALVEKISADGTQVYVSEMNYRGLGVKSYRWVSAKAFKYIY